MAIKTKIFKILPFWLAAVIVVTALQLGVALQLKGNNPISGATEEAQPKVLGVSTQIRGEPEEVGDLLVEKISEPNVEEVNAKSFLVFDLAGGQVLLAKNSKIRLGIASLTKLMTALVAYEHGDLNKSFIVEGKDTSNINPVLDLAAGDEVLALDIFNAMLVGSSNDAALALSNFVATSTGQNFVDLMNAEAKTLGMNSSHFSNALGFDSYYNYSTAEDLKILISKTQKLAAFSNLGRRNSYEFLGKFRLRYFAPATNKLIQANSDMSAIKTGYTAGSLGAMATKLQVGNRDIVILVLGSKDREGDTLKLKDAISKSFKFQ